MSKIDDGAESTFVINDCENMDFIYGLVEPRSDWEWLMADMTVRPGKSARIPNRFQRWLLKIFLDIRWRRAA